MTEKYEGALSGYRVLDLTDSHGAYCAKQMADLGADVIKIESPEGDPMRRIPPFAGDIPHPDRSLYFLARNVNRRGITLNLDEPDGRLILKRLVKTADILVENLGPDYMKDRGLDYPALAEINPGLILASMTDFGHKGPYRNWKNSNIVGFALSGAMISSGFTGKTPACIPGSAAYDATSVIAAVSILAALYSRGATGKGQYVETSVHQSARTGLFPWFIAQYRQALIDSVPAIPEARMALAAYPVYPCKDGYVRVAALTPDQWNALCRVLGNPEVLLTPDWMNVLYRLGNADDLFALMTEYTADMTMLELFEAGRREGVPIAPVLDMVSFYDDPNTKYREFFVEVDHPVVGKAEYPGPPYKWSGTPPAIRIPAPRLGEHNEEIYCGELGYSIDDLAALRGMGVI